MILNAQSLGHSQWMDISSMWDAEGTVKPKKEKWEASKETGMSPWNSNELNFNEGPCRKWKEVQIAKWEENRVANTYMEEVKRTNSQNELMLAREVRNKNKIGHLELCLKQEEEQASGRAALWKGSENANGWWRKCEDAQHQIFFSPLPKGKHCSTKKN